MFTTTITTAMLLRGLYFLVKGAQATYSDYKSKKKK